MDTNDIKDIFGIPKTDNDTFEEVVTNVPFDEKVEEIQSVIKEASPKNVVGTILKAVEESSEIIQDVVLSDDIFDMTEKETDQISGTAKVEKELEVPVSQPTDIVDDFSKVKSPTIVKDISILPGGEIEWILESPSEKYDHFYQEKISILKQILSGRQIDFKSVRKELKDSYVNISVNIFDTKELCNNMYKVQQMKDRVVQIQTDVNEQYFEWERMIELMHGVLARTQYERGKQDGVNYEHLRDMEIYFSKLRSLHKSADMIYKNLDSAYEVLSRQVTIAMPSNPIERKISSSHPDVAYTEEVPERIAEYDNLDTQQSTSVQVTNEKKTAQGPKKITWDEM